MILKAGQRCEWYQLDTVRARSIAGLTLILGCLFFLDIGTTHLILRMGGTELNPLMAGIVTAPVLHLALKLAILLGVTYCAMLAECRVRGSSAYLYCILITWYMVIVVNNVFVLLPQLPPYF